MHAEKVIENHVDEDISVYGDSDKLARVFNNILKNAISYSAENSVIKCLSQRAFRMDGDSI